MLWLLSKNGIVHTTGETNAQATVNKAIKYLDSIGMAYADHTIDDVSVIQETIKMMKDEGYQAVFVANDNKLASHGNMAILGGACLENGLPLYCAADSQVEDGGFANIGITYSDLGRDTADMTDKVLKGTPVSKIPVKFYLKTEDLAKFMFCYQQHGMFNGKQVIPEKWTYLAQKQHANNSPFTNVIDSQCGYGYCFWRCGGINGYRADGMFSQFGIVSNDDDIVYVMTAGEINEQKTRDCIWRHFNNLIIENDGEPMPKNKPELGALPDDLEPREHSKFEKSLDGKTIAMQINPILNAAGFPFSMLPIPIVYMSGVRAGNVDNIVFSCSPLRPNKVCVIHSVKLTCDKLQF